MTVKNNHWQKFSTNWEVIGSPLRPNEEDISFIETEILAKLKLNLSIIYRVVILGVTPDFISLSWSDNIEIIAIDKSSEMIANIWNKNENHKKKRTVILGHWQNIPLPDNCCDIILADGCFTQLDYPNSYNQVLQELKRILKPQGLFSSRFFLRPSQTEKITNIFCDLKAGNIGNFHLFKLRLAAALQKSTEAGIPVDYIYQIWKENISNPDEILHQLGWSLDLLKTINVYENSPSIYSFPTLEEVKNLFGNYFTELSCNFPHYEQGSLFPTIIFQNS
ncbi:methyltransferase domain-containing protein [Geminocystis sp. GBBB08]|uniref:class I SAM-dependent methyltransferase n=1 Tax=Geminocystis sp. GBBB08 TaxID=2604140 RepID=UPI0027E25B59|nr:methyltransferase domain-containing protein [Geminocystis sp. GBBB08]MBL1210749.1 methyltransferase domain-containing protein [Geminocystis sp. GBBB08]